LVCQETTVGTGRPYKEEEEIRYFSSELTEDDLVWHKDREDRIVEVIENTDWQFQFDNQLPQQLKSRLFIPKETYHRIITGTGDLKIKVVKL